MAKYSTLVSNEFSSDDEPDVHAEDNIKYPNLETLGDLSANSLDISDDQLSLLLKKYGISHGPLVETTRHLYKRLLAREIKRDANARAALATSQRIVESSGQTAHGELPQPIVSITSSNAPAQPTLGLNNINAGTQKQQVQQRKVINAPKNATPTIITGANKNIKNNSNKNAAEIYSSDEDDLNIVETARPNLASKAPLSTKGKTQQQAARTLINLGKRPLTSGKNRDVTDSGRRSNQISKDDDDDDDDEDDLDFDADQLTDDDSDDESDEDTENETEGVDDDDEDEIKTTKDRAGQIDPTSRKIAANSGAVSRRLGRRYLYAILAILAVIIAYLFVSMLE